MIQQLLKMLKHRKPKNSTPRSKNRDTNKYLYTDVHSSIIHKTQKPEATQIPINNSMSEQNVVYTRATESIVSPKNSYVKVLITRPLDCDYIWTQGF
jgi:hypothetical protein